MTGRDIYSKSERLLSTIAKLVSIFPKSYRRHLLRISRNMAGKFGIAWRYVLLKHLAKSCGRNVSIKQYVFLESVENLSLGDNISIHPFCYLEAYGGISIGNDVSIAHNVSILSVNHSWTEQSLPIKYNPIISGPVVIGDDVWIGCGCRIMANVEIDNRSVIAAGAVVTKNVPSNTIVAGVPAKALKEI